MPSQFYYQTSPSQADDPVAAMLQAYESLDEIHPDEDDTHPDTSQEEPPRLSPGILVPQVPYTTSHKKFKPKPPIPFNQANSRYLGIPLYDILNETNAFMCLEDANIAFEMDQKTIAFRVLWPGCIPKTKTISPWDYASPRVPKPRAKMAREMALMIRDMFKTFRKEDCNAPGWNVANGDVQLEEIWLTALHHVSPGSWQPELCRVRHSQ